MLLPLVCPFIRNKARILLLLPAVSTNELRQNVFFLKSVFVAKRAVRVCNACDERVITFVTCSLFFLGHLQHCRSHQPLYKVCLQMQLQLPWWDDSSGGQRVRYPNTTLSTIIRRGRCYEYKYHAIGIYYLNYTWEYCVQKNAWHIPLFSKLRPETPPSPHSGIPEVLE